MSRHVIPRDMVRYRNGYKGESLNNLRLDRNLRFYRNEIKSVPNGRAETRQLNR